LTLRRAVLTVLSTIIAFASVVFVFSLFSNDVASESHLIIEPGHVLRIADNGGFYRDAYPIRSMLKYWEIAEREVEERGLDTCNGQLGRELIDAHIRTAVDYCHSSVSLPI
jgi:hypothetical protein